tara:strand:+ start:5216 stop:8050 length:2835 start_codon:yes stop_codon:yes gene_type:complete
MAVGKSELQILINAKDNASNALGKATKALNLVGVAAIGVAGASVKMAADFDKGMREVATLTPEVSENLDAVKQDVLDLSKSLGIDAVEATGAMYQAISAGVPAGQSALEFLEIASKAAIGGVTDTETAVDGLTTVMNAFAGQNIDAQQAADVMFATVKAGKTDFAQLSGAMFNVAPLANAAGVAFEEISAAMATITAQGTPTTVATTQLRAAIQGLTKDSDDLTAIFRRQGFESGELAVSQLGLAGAAQIVTDATGGSIAEMTALLGSIEGVQAILGITGDNAEAFAQNVKNMGEAGGAAQKAFEEMEKSTSRQFEKMTNKMKATGIELGTKLLPHVNNLLDAINNMNPKLQDNIIKFGALVGVLGIASVVLPPIVTSFQLLLKTMLLLKAKALPQIIAMFSAMSVPLALIALKVMAVVAAVGALAFIVAKAGEAMGLWDDQTKKLGDAFDMLGSTVQDMKQGITQNFTDMIGITDSASHAYGNLGQEMIDLANVSATVTETAMGETDATRELVQAQVAQEEAAQAAAVAEQELAAAEAARTDAIGAAQSALEQLNIETDLSERLTNSLAKATLPTLNEQFNIVYDGLVAQGMAAKEAADLVAQLRAEHDGLADSIHYSTIGTDQYSYVVEALDGEIHQVKRTVEKTERSIRRYTGGLSEAEKATRRLNAVTGDVQSALESIGLEAEVLEKAYQELADIGIKQAAEGFDLLEEKIRAWGEESGKSVDGFIAKLGDLKTANDEVIASQERQAEATKVAAQAQRDAERAVATAAQQTHQAATAAAQAADQPLPRPPVSVSDAQTIAAQRSARQQTFGLAQSTAEAELAKAMTQIRSMSAAQRMQFAEGTLGGVSFGQGFDFGFQRGGAFTVPGSGGPDSQLVSFAATPGERVSVTRPGQAGSGVQQTIIVQGSVISERQLQTLAVNAMRNATRLNDGVLNVNSVVA